MPTTKAPTERSNKHRGDDRVDAELLGRQLDDILRKPSPRGAITTYVANKRRAIGRGNCRPSQSVVACLASNGRVREYCAALLALLDPPDTATNESLTDLALNYNASARTIGESIDDLLCGRADSHDLAVIGHAGPQIEGAAEALATAATRARFRPELVRSTLRRSA